MFKTPILLLIFNRYDTTLRVFEEIRKVKPAKLYVAADGPRPDRLEDIEKCQKTREIINLIDWDCKLHTRFLDKNLGCDKAVPEAIDWFFEDNEMGIIFEDDCLPAQSFFFFSEELLEYYKDDERVMHITGNNFLDGKIKIGEGSYYFSKQPLIWGWATWKRAWKHYDRGLSTLPKFLEQKEMKNMFDDFLIQRLREFHFSKVYNNKARAWDFTWSYSLYCQGGLCIVPKVNLVSNIGFTADALHCHNEKDRYANMPRGEITEIIHPAFVIPNKEADLYTLRNHHRYNLKGIIEIIWGKLKTKLKLK